MDHTVSCRHRRSPPSSSDRLLGLFAFSPSHPSSAIDISGSGSGGDELNEAELFYAGGGDSSESENHRSSSCSPLANTNLRRSFYPNSGILAAFPESDYSPVLRRKPSPTTTTTSMAIPRPNCDGYFSQSVPGGGGGGRRFQQSAPVKVPVVPAKARRNAGDLATVDDGEDDGNDYEMLPPHEIVARSSGVLPNATSFSVLEGVGRTLKGRDLRQVRNAIWRKTGFLD